MSKKRGVSAEEKKTRMMQIFYEKREFFQLKELEKIAPKEKGIIVQSVKDVVQSLVDDGLVDTEKIGTSVYFWAYPSKAKVIREKRLRETNEKLEETRKKIKIAETTASSLRVGREDTQERTELLKRLSSLKEEKEELAKELVKYKDNDPEVLQQMESDTKKSRDAANRWTDNIFAIKSWCSKKFSIEGSALDKQFGIPAEMDYLD